MKNKKLVAILTLLCFMFTLMPVAALADGATSTPVAPVEIEATYDWYQNATGSVYQISTVNDLVGLAKITQGNVKIDDITTIAKDDFSGKTVKLAADITFADNQYWYYNDGTTTYNYIIKDFAGSFDGDGKTITDLKIDNTVNGKSGLGLFSKITGSISNLTLDSVTGHFADGNSFGLLARDLTGAATNCHVNNVTVTSARRVASSGMMFGYLSGSAYVTGCTVTGVIGTWSGDDNTDQVGALAGASYGTKNAETGEETHITISDCSVSDLTFSFTRKTKRFGAFIGKTDYTDISNCNASDISITCDTYSQELGGFVGYAGSSSVYNNCHVTGFEFVCDGAETLEYTQYAGCNGGFVGFSAGTGISFTNCTVTELDWDINLGADYSVALGGFAGQLNCVAVMEGCSASGTIEATGGVYKDIPIGGFIGESYKALDVDECIADVTVVTTGPAGGFIGASQGGDSNFTDCEALGDVESIESVAGGFVGLSKSGNFTNCDANGNVSGNTAGGFVGEIMPNSDNIGITIDTCEANGTITGSTVASGFVGHLKDADENDANATTVTISNSTAAYDLQGDGEKIAFAKEDIATGSGSHYIASGNVIKFNKKVTLTANDSVVKQNVSVSVNIEGEGSFNASELVVNYPDSLTFNESASTLNGATVVADNAVLKLADYGEAQSYGDGVYTLVFTATKGGTSHISLTSAGFGTLEGAEIDNLAQADCTDVGVNVAIKNNVTLDEIFSGDTTVTNGASYTFGVEKSTGSYYNYELPTATIDSVPTTVVANEDGTWTVENVTGELVITGTRSPKTHNATVDGENAANDGTSATYLTDYKFTLKDNVPAGLEVGYDYTVESITIGGEEYTGYTVDGRVYTIRGEDIIGDVVVKVKTTVLDPNKFSVTVVGNGAGAATLSANVIDKYGDVTLTVPTKDGYIYTVTVSGDYTAVQNGNVYTVSNVTTAVEFTVNRAVDVKGATGVTGANVSKYVTLDETVMWLVTIGDKLDGKVYAYDGQKMFWSNEYNTYATLVVAETTPAIEAANFDILTANASSVSYNMDVNMTGKVDANDAQLVWNMYEAKYSTFTSTVTLEKFLRADVNGDKVIDVKDATAIINNILSE